jgi:exosortase K
LNRSRLWPIVLALALAWALKHYYSQASPESLKWMLAPTAWLVGTWFGAPFAFVAGYGYLSQGLHFGIVPACAGINFLIIVLGSYMCGILPHIEGWAARGRWLIGGAAAAYLVTLLANSARMVIAVWLQLHPLGFEPASVHRVEGSLVYLIFLFSFYWLAQMQVKKHAS